MLVTDNEDLALRCQMIRNHGENILISPTKAELRNAYGGNFRLTEIQAAIGIEQLRKLNQLLCIRNDLAVVLSDRLAGMDVLTCPKKTKAKEHGYYMFPVKYHGDSLGISRDMFVKAVAAELPESDHVESVPLYQGYTRPIYLNPLFKDQMDTDHPVFPFNFAAADRLNYAEGLCPVTERMYNEELILTPLVREPLEQKDINDFADAIAKVIDNAALIRNMYVSEK